MWLFTYPEIEAYSVIASGVRGGEQWNQKIEKKSLILEVIVVIIQFWEILRYRYWLVSFAKCI